MPGRVGREGWGWDIACFALSAQKLHDHADTSWKGSTKIVDLKGVLLTLPYHIDAGCALQSVKYLLRFESDEDLLAR